MSAEGQTFDEFVDEVEQAIHEYVSHGNPQWRQTSHFKAKHLDVDASGRYTGRALARLRNEAKVEQVSAGANGASAWRLVHPDDRIDHLIREIHRLSNDLGRFPRKEDLTKHGKIDWKATIEAAGLTPNDRDSHDNHPYTIPKSVVAVEYQRVADELGRVPSASDLDEHSGISSRTVRRKFGSLSKAAEDVLGVPSLS